jgi:hypothetical protein
VEPAAVSIALMMNNLGEAHVRGHKRPWTPDEDDRLRRFVTAGWSRHAISVVLGRSDDTVMARAREIQIPLKVRSRRRRPSIEPTAAA